jgi:hypothetical protein
MFLLLNVSSYGQDSTSKASNSTFHQGLTVSYVHHEVQFLSIGGKLLFNYGKENEQVLSTGICMDVALNARVMTLAPRIYVELRQNYFGVRANLINYIRQTDNDLRFIPEIFLSYKDYVSLGVGYGFDFSRNSFEDISLYRVSLTYAFLK